MKKLIVLILAVFVLAPLCVHANSEPADIIVTLNGNPLELAQPPMRMYDEDGFALVFLPIRELFDAMGFDVMWDSRTQTYSIKCPRTRLEFLVVVGRLHARRINEQGNVLAMPGVTTRTIDGSAMISAISPARGINPQRTALFAFNAWAVWHEEEGLVDIAFRGISDINVDMLFGFSTYARDISSIYTVCFWTGELILNEMNTFIGGAIGIGNVFERWADLNELNRREGARCEELASAVDIRIGKGAGIIGLMSPRTPLPVDEENYLVLYVSHTDEFETRLQGEHAAALLASLEKTLRGLFYFGEFELVLV